jgi:hypothetical protein
MKSRYTLFPAALLLIVAIASCKSDSTSTANTTTGTIPTVGSTYTFRDSASGSFSSASDLRYLVIESSSAMLVWREDTTGNRVADTTRYWFKKDANGNLEESPWPITLSRSDWFTMPYATKSLVTSKQTEVNGSAIDTVITNAEGESDGTYRVGDKQYATKRVKLTVTTAPQDGSRRSNVYHYQYSPDLGIEVAYDEEDWSFQGASQPAEHFRLVSMVQK